MDEIDTFSKPYPQSWWELVAISIILVTAFVVFVIPCAIVGIFRKKA